MDFPLVRRLSPSANWRPTLCVVIDTEEEFDWSAPFDAGATTTRNIECQHLGQAIFDRHGVVPTYVIDYPVAASAEARAVLQPFLAAGRCEIGAHLHPWVNPPDDTPVDDYHSYPGNLPAHSERQKLSNLAQCIEEGFGHRPTIYKAGRYGVGPATLDILADLGFRIDVSVVPHTDFRARLGPDFRGFPDVPFETAKGIMALPLSVGFVGALADRGPAIYPILSGKSGLRLHLPGIVSRLKLLERLRLSPEGHSLDDLIRQTRSAIARGQRFFMLTFHSSSLLPGATSYVRSQADRDAFLATLDRFISVFQEEYDGRFAAVSEAARMLANKDHS
ncbi:polysaccharide deacetylase family protein [Telmatospirillum sp.]|uniref:polysaccharide deacetylase family protein n=1 Tax=Telmatospirillum sp. TaxID=2079197 RepID=UPI00284652B7|nr:polysaccharide deacetylase family protein [Telmatospirillum sp.]MDR3439921.1 polysaccharide deacetylase family protein [Telmatospirillum sp.]